MEDGGPGSVGRPGRFVVHLHAARRLHFDLRLEFGGVLASWALPRGPSLDPAEKRLAVETEPHPLDYHDFEGVIPEGGYGAGALIAWDRGTWIPRLDPVEGMGKGKQLFELKGHKLRGLWTLVRSKQGGTWEEGRQWLLIKKPDGAATGEDAADLPAGSVLSGLTVEELAAGSGRAAELRREVAREMAERGDEAGPAPGLDDVSPMLAEVADGPFSRAGWLFELKYDGYRLLAATGAVARTGRGGGDRPVHLAYRSGRDATSLFPELTRALAALPYPDLLLDGEVVVLDDDGRPSFQRLQRRARPAPRARSRERAPATGRSDPWTALEDPVVYQAFDLLALAGHDLRPLPLARRKELLRRVLPAAGPLRYVDHVAERGEELYAAARRLDLEGLVAKRADSPYRGGRSGDWLKIRAGGAADFVVVGWTSRGADRTLAALHLGVRREGAAGLAYAGKVGSGFTARDRRELLRRLERLERETPALDPSTAPRGRSHTWVEPRLVVEVRYTEVTAGGQLRHPVFLRLRDDKPPAECTGPPALHAEEPAGAGPEDDPAGDAAPVPASPPPHRVPVTNPDKVFWPAGEGSGETGPPLTKADLVAWYDGVADLLLPYLRDRPLVLDRYPDGIHGKSFFQRNAPDPAPDWVRTGEVWSESGTATRYVLCDDAATLRWLANLGTVPLHLWSSRVGSLQHPDWCILDLDAKDAPFTAVVEVARALRRWTERAGLPAFVKTSGATGLHVLIPLGGGVPHEASRQLAEVLARLVVAELPKRASVARLPRSRRGKVYVDPLQNGHGKLLVAPYATRPLPGAPVSMPLHWAEVDGDLDPAAFTLRTAPERIASWKPGGGGADPFRGVLAGVRGEGPDLLAALERLAEVAG